MCACVCELGGKVRIGVERIVRERDESSGGMEYSLKEVKN